MPHEDYLEWNLKTPVPIKHALWTLHPNVILWVVTSWIIGGHTVAIPYRWHAVGYHSGEWFEAPKTPKPQEKYKEICMFKVVEMFKEYMTTKWKDKHKTGMGDVRYPKILADVKSDLVEIEGEIADNLKDIATVDRHRAVMMKSSNHTEKEMKALDEVLQLRLVLNKVLVSNRQGKKRLVEREKCILEEISCQMTEAEKLHKDSKEDDSTKGDMERLFKKFREGKISTTARSTTTITSTANTIVQGIPTVTALIQNETREKGSLVSVSAVSTITDDTITETLPCITKPATRVTDVGITERCEEMKRYKSISGMPISKTVGTRNALAHVLVEVEPEILTCLLDPDTKRYVKIASNKTQAQGKISV